MRTSAENIYHPKGCTRCSFGCKALISSTIVLALLILAGQGLFAGTMVPGSVPDACIHLCFPQQGSASGILTGNAHDLDETIAAMLASSEQVVVSAGMHLKSLVYDLHPTLFVKNGAISKPGGRSPICVDVDAPSVGLLTQTGQSCSKVELITVRIDKPGDLSVVLDMANLAGFDNLKYVCFICGFDICSSPGCEAKVISQMIQGNAGSNVIVLYKVSIAY